MNGHNNWSQLTLPKAIFNNDFACMNLELLQSLADHFFFAIGTLLMFSTHHGITY